VAIVGISGSLIQGGNTDRLVQSLLGQSGREYRFVNLSTLDFLPCRGFIHLCAKSNICPLEDGLRPCFEPILEADALNLALHVTSDKFKRWADCPRTVAEVERYAQVLAEVTGALS
jgi:multimeric flavodoxin WrbA